MVASVIFLPCDPSSERMMFPFKSVYLTELSDLFTTTFKSAVEMTISSAFSATVKPGVDFHSSVTTSEGLSRNKGSEVYFTSTILSMQIFTFMNPLSSVQVIPSLFLVNDTTFACDETVIRASASAGRISLRFDTDSFIV